MQEGGGFRAGIERGERLNGGDIILGVFVLGNYRRGAAATML